MATDIVPKLYEQIQKDFQQNIEKSRSIKAFREKMERNAATSQEVSLYAADLGECASKALCDNLMLDALPDQKLYWNIAERTIKPLLEEVYKMVNDTAAAVKKTEDEKIGLHIGSVNADFPEDRVHDLLDKLIETLEADNGQ